MKTNERVTVTYEVSLTLTEVEARALDAIFCYGVEGLNSWLESYYKMLGKHYLEPHKAGVITLGEALRNQLVPGLKRIDKMRASIERGI